MCNSMQFSIISNCPIRFTGTVGMIPNWPGWQLIGRYPEGDPDGVGSWLLTSGGEAMLLELPPGLTADDVRQALIRFGTTLRYITASHTHGDHLDPDVWAEMLVELDDAEMIAERDAK